MKETKLPKDLGNIFPTGNIIPLPAEEACYSFETNILLHRLYIGVLCFCLADLKLKLVQVLDDSLIVLYRPPGVG